MSVNMKVPFEGEKYLLTQAVQSLGGGVATIRLFKNNFTPGNTSEYADFTEADYSGYSSQNLPAPSIQSSADGSGRAYATVAEVTFSHSGGGTSNTVYGFYITVSTPNRVLYAANLSAPKTMSASGHEIKITPTLTAQTEF